jgi:predicted nucleic acid-binding protein
VKWLLDTNVVSETIRRQPRECVISWIARHRPDEMTISLITVAEIRNGIGSAPESNRRKLMRWLESDVESKFAERILPLTTEVLIDWLQMSRKLAAERMLRRAADLLIASTARVHGLTLVTRNVRHFADTGVIVYDPWDGKTHVMDAPDAR